MQKKKTCKTGNVHDFSVCVYTSHDFAENSVKLCAVAQR